MGITEMVSVTAKKGKQSKVVTEGRIKKSLVDSW
jgi:hypothetical protein